MYMVNIQTYIRPAVMIVAVASLAACAGVEPGPEPSASVVRVGVCANSPPVIFRDKDGSYAGFEAELAGSLAASLGRSAVLVECDWEDLIPALVDNRIDIIMSGMTITESRSVRVAFTDAYMRSGQAALTTNQQALRFPGRTALLSVPVRLGTEKGTVGEIVARQYFTGAKNIAFKDPEKAVKAVLAGRADLFMHDAPVIWWYASQYEAQGLTALPFLITEEGIAWAVRKDDAELLAGANRFIAAWQQDGRLQELLSRWLPKMK
jgi:polar amino acid transport system substrate-binding protein